MSLTREQQEALKAAEQRMQQQQGPMVMAVAEPVATMATGAIAQPLSGLAGGLRTAYGLTIGDEDFETAARRGVDWIEGTQEAMTYMPRTQYGQAGLQKVGEVFEPIARMQEAVESRAEKGGGLIAEQFTEDPTIKGVTAGIARSLPAVLETLLPPALAVRLKPDVDLLTKTGQATPELKRILSEQGIAIEDLMPAAREVIPEQVPRGAVTGLPRPEQVGRQAAEQQLRAGGREATLAPLMVRESGRIGRNPLAVEAIKQWDDPGLVRSVVTATPETKQRMLDMLEMRRRIGMSKRTGMYMRPTDITGQSAADRIQYLGGVLQDGRKALDSIAQNQLAGRIVNREPVIREFGEQLDALGAKAVQTETGDFVIDFSGSQISQNKTAQRVIRQVYALLNEPQPVDALRMHNLKKQLDEIIDYKKSIGQGLSEAGQRVIRNVRRSLNDEVRRVSDEANLGYSEVNDSLAELLTLFDNLDDVTGSTTNILDASSAQKMGQQFRKTMSNYGVRTDLLNAIQELDAMAAKYGGEFNDDMLDLAMFANALDTRFEPVASTSFRGEIAAAQKQAAQQQAIRTAARGDLSEMFFGKLIESYQKLRGVTDEQAYKAMEELLRAGLNE
jgi:hypothetical protein